MLNFALMHFRRIIFPDRGAGCRVSAESLQFAGVFLICPPVGQEGERAVLLF